MKINPIMAAFVPNDYNPILDTDSYKISHWLQFPDGSSELFVYGESRGGKYSRILMYGLQIILLKYLSVKVTLEMIDEAEELLTQHGLGESFNRAGWEYIVKKYKGTIPVTIRAVPEGTVLPVKNVLFTIHCSDPIVFWIASYIETLIMRVWAPITTATKSFHIKQTIQRFVKMSSSEPINLTNAFAEMYETGNISSTLFKFHDFGARGASSYETASINGSAHLVNMLGTDTLSALLVAKHFYGAKTAAGFSIDASEHSTMTVLGPEGEFLQFKRMCAKFGHKFAFACVSDGFNIYNAITNGWGGELRDIVIAMNAMLIVRPDSGNAITMPIECVRLLDECFGHTINDKGYKVLNHVRVIQGDGIDEDDVEPLYAALIEAGYSSDNLAIGMGGGLLQKTNRDTCKFACKNSYMKINGTGVNVRKDPITDPGKKSKLGRMTLIENDGEFTTVTELTDEEWDHNDKFGNVALKEVYGQLPDGSFGVKLVYTFEDIRRRAETFLA